METTILGCLCTFTPFVCLEGCNENIKPIYDYIGLLLVSNSQKISTFRLIESLADNEN